MSFKYILSYTSLSLSVYDSKIIADLYLKNYDWDEVKTHVIENNVLQKGTLSARKRQYIEFKKRLEQLTPQQLKFYKEASSTELRYLAMFSCFKMYQFIYDFATEVMRQKLLLFDYKLLNSDYESFYESKAITYENLNTISLTTQNKLKQVMFKMFEQSELIDSVKTKNIQKLFLTEQVIKLIVKDDAKYLSAFLYSDHEINEYKKRYK